MAIADALEEYFAAARAVNELVVQGAGPDGADVDRLRAELDAARERRDAALAALREADPHLNAS